MLWFACLPASSLLLGTAITLWGATRAVRAVRFTRHASPAEALVTALSTTEYGSRTSRHTRSRPVLTFHTPDGTRITTTSFTVSPHPVGSTLTALYDPTTPTRARPPPRPPPHLRRRRLPHHPLHRGPLPDPPHPPLHPEPPRLSHPGPGGKTTVRVQGGRRPPICFWKDM
ncbi:DUF3592 domain-containing protein [Actinocorallia lasiicapitis]